MIGGWITYFCQESRGSNKIYWCLCKNTFYSKAAILALCCSKFKNSIFRSSHQTCSMKNAVLKNFAIFTGKHLSWNIFLIILRALAWNLIKKRLQHRCFPGNIAKFLRTHILNNICERVFLNFFKVNCFFRIFAGSYWKPYFLVGSIFCKSQFSTVFPNFSPHKFPTQVLEMKITTIFEKYFNSDQ